MSVFLEDTCLQCLRRGCHDAYNCPQIILDMVERGKEGMKRERKWGKMLISVRQEEEEDVGVRYCIILSLFP